ncbi:MAG TPA: DUF2232 domain-containing protein [Thermoanaerobaculia bacterium]|nr:DUF2232 domain-containing protein [Thermoanaerobaculia bacterium]
MIESSLPQSEPVLLPGRPFGRQVRSVIGYSLLTALMVVTPMLVFVPAALLHCAIRNGRRAAWVVLVLALAIASLYAAAVPATGPDAQKMAWSYLAGVALAITLPAMAAIPLVERGESFGNVLVFLLVGAILGLALTESASQSLLSFSPYAAQVAQAKQTSVEFVQMYRAKGMPADMVQLAEQWIGFSTFVLPAVILINMTLVFVLSLLMLGRLKAWREMAARRGDASALGAYLFRNFALPDWVLFAFVLGGLTPLVSGLLQKVAANTLTIVAFLYILQGLAIFRFMLTAMGVGFAGTMLGWLLLAFLTLTGVGPLLLGVAGLFDSFFDFRHFKKRKDDSHESHSD